MVKLITRQLLNLPRWVPELIDTLLFIINLLAKGLVSCIFLQGFNGADLRNVCTEAGMSAIRAERDYVIHEDFMKVKLRVLS